MVDLVAPGPADEELVEHLLPFYFFCFGDVDAFGGLIFLSPFVFQLH